MKKVLAFFLLFSLPLVVVPCLDFGSLRFDAGILFIGNAESDSAPSPVVNTIGFTVPLNQPGRIRFQAGVQLFYTLYQMVDGKPLPVEIEVPGETWVSVLGAIFEPKVGVGTTVAETIDISVFVSPTVIMRFPLFTSVGSENDGDLLFQYFLNEVRYFYPGAELSVAWKISPFWSVSVSAKVFYPIYHEWIESARPFWDELFVTGSLGFMFRLW